MFEVAEIIRPLESGMTNPFQCRLDDGNVYAVKGRDATARGLIAEVISARLGQRLGLPIPEFQYCSVPPGLFSHLPDRSVESALGRGTCFASQWVEPTEVFSLPMIKRVGNEVLARLYVFDHWIGNGDRTLTPHGGNVNLLMSLSDDRLVAFDHNLAFLPGQPPDDWSLHVGRGSWLTAKDIVGFPGRLRQEMLDVRKSLSDICEDIPEDWVEKEPNMFVEVGLKLDHVIEDEFWENLG